MSTICHRCAMRIRAASSCRRIAPSSRPFSASTSKRRQQITQFNPTSQPELDTLLASLRNKWLIPAALTKRERRLTSKPRYKEYLEHNDEIVTIGEEDIKLQHMSVQTDRPSLKRYLLPKIIDLMAKGEKGDWKILPLLLSGLKRAHLTPEYNVMAKIARKAIEAGHFGVIMTCLRQPELTQMTLYKEDVLNKVIYGVRDIAQADHWSEAATSKALRDMNEIAQLLEDEAHGGGHFLRENDPRTRPELLAIYLELAAVYALKHQDGKDVDGKVKAYADRVLLNMQSISKTSDEVKARIKPASHEPSAAGVQMEIIRGVPIYHGLHLATKLLGADMPMPELAEQVVRNWEEGLTALTEGVKLQAKEKAHGLNRWPRSGTYGWKALKMWRSCLKVEAA